MKEGILTEQNGKIFPYDRLVSALYGFNNKYGLACRIAEGGTNPTKVGPDTEKDRIELKILGLVVPPEDLKTLPLNHVKYISETVSEVDMEKILEVISLERKEEDMKGIDPIKKYNKEKKIFECLNNTELKKILRDIREMPERVVKKQIESELILDMIKEKRDAYIREKGLEL